MSWLVEMAGRAENLLNQLDQTANETLNTPEVTGHRRNSKSRKNRNDGDNSIGNNNSHSDSSSTTYLADPSPPPSSSSAYNQSINNDKTESNNFNSSNGQSNGRPRSKPTTKQETQDSNATTKSLNLTKSTTLLNGNKKEKSDEELLDFLNSPNQREIDEISLLKSEISTQVRETGMILKNFKKLQQDYEIQGKTLEEVQKKLEVGIQNNKLAAKDTDKYNETERLQNEIKTKDDELKTIRNRLDEALEKLKHMDCSTQNRVEQLELENRQVKESNTEMEDKVHHLTLQLTTVEKNLQSVKESLVASESEFNVYKEKAKSILRTKDELIASIKDDKNQNNEGSTFLTESQIMAEIGSLKNERELLHAEITQNRSFCDSLKEDNRRLEKEIHSNRISNLELQEALVKERDIKNTIQEENLQLSQNLSALQLELEREKSEKRKLDERLKRQEKEFGMSSSAMSRSFSGSLNEFNNNQNQNLIQSSSSSVSRNLNQSPVPMMTSLNNCDNIPDERDNLKTRIKALTQSLLEKQSLINSISADKQLLHLRVERLQTQIQDMTENSESNSNGSLPQTVISNQPLYLSESPWDTRIKTKVKRAYSRVDNLCCQFGIAMRHRPNLRLGFSTYIIFLHLWVFFVLFYWSHHATISNSYKA